MLSGARTEEGEKKNNINIIIYLFIYFIFLMELPFFSSNLPVISFTFLNLSWNRVCRECWEQLLSHKLNPPPEKKKYIY